MVDARAQERLDALSARLGCGLTIDSPDGELIAYSTHPDDADPARITTILRRRVAPEILVWEEQHLPRDEIEPVVVPANPALDMSARLCVPMRRQDRNVGLLWLVHTGTITDCDGQALREGARELAELLGRHGDTAPSPSMLMRRLMEGGATRRRTTSWSVADRRPRPVRSSALGLAPTTPDSVRRWQPDEVPRVRAVLDRLEDRTTVGGFLTGAYALLVRRSDQSASTFRKAVREAVRPCLAAGSGLAAGSSECAELTPQCATVSREQALHATELGALDPHLPGIPRWADLGGYRALLISTPAGSDTCLELHTALKARRVDRLTLARGGT